MTVSIPQPSVLRTRRRMWRTVVSLSAAILAFAAIAEGQPRADPRQAQPERPTVATHAFTVAPGFVEIESGVQGFRPSPGTTQIDTPSVVKIGLTSYLQLDLFVSASEIRQSGGTAGGLADAAVGLKWRLARTSPVLGDFAVQATLKLPTGSETEGTSTGTTDFSLLAISSRSIGPFAIDLNAGFTRRSGDGSQAPTIATLWTASAGFPIAGPAGWAVEVFGYPGTRGPAGAPPAVGLLTGPTFALSRFLVLDAGIVTGIAGTQPTTWYVGVTWNIGQLAGRSSRARRLADLDL